MTDPIVHSFDIDKIREVVAAARRADNNPVIAVREAFAVSRDTARRLVDALDEVNRNRPWTATAVDAPMVYLAVNDRMIGWVDTNRDRADEYARNTGGVLVALPVLADYRTNESGS